MNNRLVKNTAALYAMNIAKMIIPLITLPYLTRVLTKDSYGVVSYVKAVMQYAQLIIDFGFLLSGTKDIVKANGDHRKIQEETWNIFGAKMVLALAAGGVLLILTAFIPILGDNLLYVVLSFVPVILTCFLFDYLFRGLEQMHVITLRFVMMKLISTGLTFVCVKSDADILLIPALDILGSVVAIAMVALEMRKRGIRIVPMKMKVIIQKIRESAVYFLSDFATTAFGALNTLLIGFYLSAAEVADWSLCMQLVNAVQSMYSPIINGIYPEMVKTRSIVLIKKTLKLFMPIVTVGCIFTWFVAKYAILIVGGRQYLDAVVLLRCLIPVMFFGFLAMLFGWPALGAINKNKETTITTVCAALVQVVGLLALLMMKQFTVINIAIVRAGTECILFVMRYLYYRHYQDLFAV